MTAILYFLIWALFIFAMMRFGCGSHVMGHGHHHRHGDERQDGGRINPSTETTDPVCGTTVKTASAKSSVYDGRIYYFCSQTCREKFEAAPGSYIKGTAVSPISMEPHHGTH